MAIVLYSSTEPTNIPVIINSRTVYLRAEYAEEAEPGNAVNIRPKSTEQYLTSIPQHQLISQGII